MGAEVSERGAGRPAPAFREEAAWAVMPEIVAAKVRAAKIEAARIVAAKVRTAKIGAARDGPVRKRIFGSL